MLCGIGCAVWRFVPIAEIWWYNIILESIANQGVSLTSSTGHGFRSAHPTIYQGLGLSAASVRGPWTWPWERGDEHEMPSEIPGLWNVGIHVLSIAWPLSQLTTSFMQTWRERYTQRKDTGLIGKWVCGRMDGCGRRKERTREARGPFTPSSYSTLILYKIHSLDCPSCFVYLRDSEPEYITGELSRTLCIYISCILKVYDEKVQATEAYMERSQNIKFNIYIISKNMNYIRVPIFLGRSIPATKWHTVLFRIYFHNYETFTIFPGNKLYDHSLAIIAHFSLLCSYII